MSTREVPIVVITGYLGSGKTTVMQNILKQERRKVALIVNDMGSINIDASTFKLYADNMRSLLAEQVRNVCVPG